MCTAVKSGAIYDLAHALMDVVPDRLGEIFNLAMEKDGKTGQKVFKGVYVPHRLQAAGSGDVREAVMATICGIGQRYRLDAEAIDDHLEKMPMTGEAIAELFVQLSHEMICEEGLASNVREVRLTQGAHFLMFKAVVHFFLSNYARDPRAFYRFLGDIYFAIEFAVEEAVVAGVVEAVENGFYQAKAPLGENEFKKIIQEETRAVLVKFFPRIGKMVFLNAVGRAIEAAIKRADEIALAKIPPLPQIKR